MKTENKENKYIDSKKGEVNMSTVAIKNTMVMNNTEKKAGLVERFKKYVLDNAECLEMVMQQDRS